MPPFLLLIFATQVFKVEPPNWWLQHSLNPVRVMVRGKDLAGARVRADLPVGRVRVNSSGTYLFADVTVPPGAAAGPHPLRIGAALAPFELLPLLPRPGRFQGFSPDDVMYLIMVDRFSNGDPSNDDPPDAPGLFDPAQPRSYHGGDLQGIINRLPYLKDLGVTAIWLTPVYRNRNYHGYGAIDYRRPPSWNAMSRPSEFPMAAG